MSNMRYNTNMKRWKTSRTTVYNLGYHFIWCTKYRRKVLDALVAERLKDLLKHKAKLISVEIVSLEILEEHVHLFVRCSPVDAPHWIMQQLKGYTSRMLRQEMPSLKSRLPCLWTRSYYCESVGHISEDVVKKYIDDQRKK